MPLMPYSENNPIGYLVIQERLKIAVYEPRNKFHFFMMRLFFGWEYEPCQKGDNDEKEERRRK